MSHTRDLLGAAHDLDDESGLARLGEHRSIFLSASVPRERDFPAGLRDPGLRREEARFAKDSRPRNIRSALNALVRQAGVQDYRLVFGAHPAISPMVLAAGRDLGLSKGRILIFQSRFFESSIPNSTYELANWSAGQLVLTPARVGPQMPTPELQAWSDRAESLTEMRSLMVRVPGLQAAIFVGGMSGILEEADLFAGVMPPRPMFAIGSTGGAASALLARGSEYSGNLDPQLLDAEPAYSLVAKEIFAQI